MIDAKTPLYPCCSVSKLEANLMLLEMKFNNGLSDKGFDDLLSLLQKLLPSPNGLPPQREQSPRSPSPQREQTPPSPPKKRWTSSRTQKLSSQKQYSEPAKKPKAPCEETSKKQVSGSITTLLEGKGKKGQKDFIVPKAVMDHFLNLMKVPQTRNLRPPPSDYERTLNKDRWRAGTELYTS